MQHAHPTKRLAFGALLLSVAFLGASCSSTKLDGGAFLSVDNAETWEQRVFVRQEKKKTITIDALQIENIFFDPQNADIVYLASKDSGLFKSTNAGEQWTQLPLAPQRIRDIGISAEDTNEIYVTTGTTISKTGDGGEHWETIYTDPRNAIILRVEPDWFQPNRVYATTSTGNVLVSIDGGVNWTASLEVDEPITDFIVDRQDSRILYAVEMDKNIHKSVDGGVTWKELITEDTVWNKVAGVFAESDQTNTRVKKPSAFRTLVVDPNNHMRLFLLSPQGILRSTDGGVSWAYLDTLIAQGAAENSNIKSFMVMPGNSNVYVFALGRVIHKSIDAGATWKTIENFPSARNITVLAASTKNPERIFAGTEEVPKKKGLFGF